MHGAKTPPIDAVVQLNGGFGNQLFQYAFGMHLATAHGRRVAYDVEFYQQPQSVAHNRLRLIQYGFNMPECGSRPPLYAAARRLKWLPPALQQVLFGMTYIKCRSNSYAPVSYPDGLTYYTGLWQSPAYFASIEVEVRETIRKHLLAAGRSPTVPPRDGTVGFHVRRGDYLAHKQSENLDYAAYLSASLERMSAELGAKSVPVTVFTDDPDWCAANLHAPGLEVRRGGGMLDDFLGLMHCRHKIISNSTFAWWAAFLGETDDGLTLAPSRWHTGATNTEARILRPNWIEIAA